MKGKKLIVLVTVVLVVAMVAVGVFVVFDLGSGKDVQKKEGAGSDVIEIGQVSTGDVIKSISSNGTIRTNELVSVKTPVRCKVDEVLVQVGAKVDAGDALFSLDKETLDKEYESANQQLRAAMQESGYTKPSYDYISVRAPKAASVQEVNVSKNQMMDEALAENEDTVLMSDEDGQKVELIVPQEGKVYAVYAKEGKTVKQGDVLFKVKVASTAFAGSVKKVQDAQAKVDLIAQNMDDPFVYCEIDGIVDEINEEMLQGVLEKDSEVLSVQPQSGYTLNIKITQDELSSIFVGMESQIKFESGDIAKGSVAHINYKADENGQFGVSISFSNTADAGNQIYPGIKATASIILEKSENTLRVPLGALKQDEQGYYVMVYVGEDEDISGIDAADIPMEKRYVERGLVNSLYAQVLSGVQDGEKVVIVKTTNSNDMFGDMFGGNMQTIEVR
ncbi:MAG: HlyD family efflux transporter periplasmic adaptor subunit [Clostridia bacterium]|jgi:multidrug efflux pump subunit AcrA (membrane-fusion protein)|nr:HlyD family efflux transporter periplasmic adaptor subunit [Clostridia bacterium]MBT7123378.1 HlyD family efflux transporter periplasmic adaptor subunit [Clostridia bacterium]